MACATRAGGRERSGEQGFGESPVASRVPVPPSAQRSSVARRLVYRGYDILPAPEGSGWAAWILARDVPYGRVSGHPSDVAAVRAAKEVIDRREAQPDNR